VQPLILLHNAGAKSFHDSGYARVSTGGQSLDAQVKQLRAFMQRIP
jgi:hypothetical protein